jgi:hypothetical protein
MVDASLLAGASMLVVSAVVLYKAKAAEPKQVITKAMCPCGHAINYHEKLAGRCKASIREPIVWFGSKPVKWQEFRCDCQVYAGPELIRGTTGLPVLPLPDVIDDDK